MEAFGDAGVRAVELADEEVDVAAELGAGAGAGDVGLPFVAEGGPVAAVEVGGEEAVVEGVPGFVEDDLLFFVEVDVDGGREGDVLGRVGVEGDGADAGAGVAAGWPRSAAFEVEDFLGVGREGDAGFEAGAGGELARGGGLAGELVERVGVDVLLAGGVGEEGEGFAVGADDGEADAEMPRGSRVRRSRMPSKTILVGSTGFLAGAVAGLVGRLRSGLEDGRSGSFAGSVGSGSVVGWVGFGRWAGGVSGSGWSRVCRARRVWSACGRAR